MSRGLIYLFFNLHIYRRNKLHKSVNMCIEL